MRQAYTEPLFCVECALNPSEFRGMLEKLGMREVGLSPQSFLFFFFNQYINISLSTCPCHDEHCFRKKKNVYLDKNIYFWLYDSRMFSLFSSFYDHITI